MTIRICHMCKQVFLRENVVRIGKSKLKYFFCPDCAKKLYKQLNRNDTWRVGLKDFYERKGNTVKPLKAAIGSKL